MLKRAKPEKGGIFMAYITCSHLTLGYDGRTVASDLNFKVEEGDYLCIVGENGTGKSTLIKTLLGLQEFREALVAK